MTRQLSQIETDWSSRSVSITVPHVDNSDLGHKLHPSSCHRTVLTRDSPAWRPNNINDSHSHQWCTSFYIGLYDHGPCYQPLYPDKGVTKITSNSAVSATVGHLAEVVVYIRTDWRSISLVYDTIDLIVFPGISCRSRMPLVSSFLLVPAVMNVVMTVIICIDADWLDRAMG